jgi:hypothetical protein
VLRRAFLGCVVCAVVASLTACGGGGVQSTLDPVAEAATKSASAGGVKVTMKATFTSGTQSGGMTAEGFFDEDAGELTFDFSNLLAGAPQADAVEGMRVIYTKEDGHTILYVGMPNLTGVIPGGKNWIKADLDELAKMTGTDLGQLLGQPTQNPADTLNLLRSVGEVEEAGADVIDGTPVTLYHATVDLEKAAAEKGVADEMVQQLLAAGASTQIPVDVWIGDDDGLVRQMRMAYEAPNAAEPMSALITMTMSDWGMDISVETPSDDEVFDATEYASQFGTS